MRRFAMLALVLALAAFALLVAVPMAGATKPPDHKITICHATDSNTNPYVVITVDVASTKFAGHEGHDGPVWNPTLKAQHVKWGDVIPPTSNDGTRSVTPKNWPEGAPILRNGCKIPGEGTTTTTAPAQTTTTQPEATTTVPGETTTSAPEQTTTSQPEATTTTMPMGDTTTTQPGSGTTVVDNSTTSTSTFQGSATRRSAPCTEPRGCCVSSCEGPPAEMPFTGSSSVPLAAGAGTLLAAGVALVFGARRRRLS